MPSLELQRVLGPIPSTQRNFSSKLSFNVDANCIAFGCGKSAFIRSLDGDVCVQFTGHGANVSVVKFAPCKGSNYVCSGDEQGKVMVWSWTPEEGATLKNEFQVLAGAVSDISWDVEGKRLCVVGDGRDNFGAFISWDTGNSLGEVGGHSKKVNACHIKQSRPMRCFTVGDDGAVVFYQGPPFRFAGSDRTHHEQGKFIRDVAFSPGIGTYAVTVGSDRRICCFDGKTGEFLKHVEDPEDPVDGGIFAVDWLQHGDESTKFVTASADAAIRVWDIKTGKVIQKWVLSRELANQQVGIVAAGPDTVVSVSLDGALNVFQVGQEMSVQRIEGHNKGITAIATNPLVSGSYDGRLVKWDDTTKNPKMTNSHSNLIVTIDTGDSVSSVSWDDTLQVNGSVKHEFPCQPMVASSNQSAIAVATVDNEIQLFHATTGELIASTSVLGAVSAISLGNELVAVGYDKTNMIEIFKASNLSPQFKFEHKLQATPSCLSFSPSEAYLAAGDVMGKIILYDVSSKTVKTTRWSFHTGRINSMAWRPVTGIDEEEDYVATASLDTNLFVYSVKRPMKIIKQLNVHKDGISATAWSDQRHLFSAGADACIKEWEFDLN
ncbi:LAMI_0G04412g1_1 [Lachancea mirantina]|uniref:LAMI_0G04412g1_1 n=1 Tax=Lachancea mirantina TaxID=1230905 RepID=A0A1G4K8G8_9SACH|nr:LAMI_0G04412g1_1 [Lachancea mirantina]